MVTKKLWRCLWLAVVVCHGLMPSEDVGFMRLALEQARLAAAAGEVPVGAVVVDGQNVVLSVAHNEVEKRFDASAHAELNALRSAAFQRQNWRLLNCTLYCSLEPCAACLSVAYAFRLKRIVYAAPDLRLGAVTSWIRLPSFRHPFHDDMDIEGGLLEADSAALLKDFFKQRRLNNSSLRR